MGTLAEAGVEQRLIQKLLGHSGVRIPERYTSRAGRRSGVQHSNRPG
jgi:site-specific recombinase XerD